MAHNVLRLRAARSLRSRRIILIELSRSLEAGLKNSFAYSFDHLPHKPQMGPHQNIAECFFVLLHEEGKQTRYKMGLLYQDVTNQYFLPEGDVFGASREVFEFGNKIREFFERPIPNHPLIVFDSGQT